MAGWIFTHLLKTNYVSLMNSRLGFSLPETLVAVLLFTLSCSALLNYHQMLAKGFQQQMQQRESWRRAWLRFEGYQGPDWQTSLSQESMQGCIMFTASAVSHGGQHASLSQLHCEHSNESFSANLNGRGIYP